MNFEWTHKQEIEGSFFTDVKRDYFKLCQPGILV